MEKETTKTWLERVRKALLAEGFKPTSLQRLKPDQFFGLVKDVDEVWQMHVRGFRDGRLEPEIEISRFYLEHPRSSRPATKELRAILDKHGIPYRKEYLLAAPMKGAEAPVKLTDWRRTLIHPRFFKGAGMYGLIMGVLAFVLCAHFWGSIEAGARTSLALYLILAGGLLLAFGVGVLWFTAKVEKALKRE